MVLQWSSEICENYENYKNSQRYEKIQMWSQRGLEENIAFDEKYKIYRKDTKNPNVISESEV